MNFLGTFEQALSSAGRVGLPRGFQEAGTSLIATRGFEPCIHVFPLHSWAGLAGRINALPFAGDNARHVRRLIFAAAAPLALEPDGTLLLPPHLLEYAAIQQRAMFVGMHTYFELWDPERWSRAADQAAAAVARWSEPNLPAILHTL